MTENINWLERINETAAYIKSKVEKLPKTAIILGTGLGELVEHIDIKTAVPYEEIPNFPVSTVEGHKGRLIFGNLGDKYIMAMLQFGRKKWCLPLSGHCTLKMTFEDG